MKEEKIRHWLDVARSAAAVMEFCLAQVMREIADGTVTEEVTEESTAPIRPPLPQKAG